MTREFSKKMINFVMIFYFYSFVNSFGKFCNNFAIKKIPFCFHQFFKFENRIGMKLTKPKQTEIRS
jgi:hypothetical protein